MANYEFLYNNNKLRPHSVCTQAQSFFFLFFFLPKMDRIQSYLWVIFLLADAPAAADVDVVRTASWKRLANQQSWYVYKIRNVSFMVYKCCDCGFDLSTTLFLIVIYKNIYKKSTLINR